MDDLLGLGSEVVFTEQLVLPLVQVDFTDIATVFDVAVVVVNRHVVLESPVFFPPLLGSNALVLFEVVIITLSLILILVLTVEVNLRPV